MPAGLSGQVVDTLAVDSLGEAVEPPAAQAVSFPDTAEVADTLVPYRGPLPPAAATLLSAITTVAPQAPQGMGLIPAGMAEAEIAAEHVVLAGRDSTNLSNMQRHMAHVLHAVDPDEVGQGPGMGFGVRRAAQGVLTHVEQLQGLEGIEPLPGVLTFHAPFAAQAARGTLGRIDEVVALARQVQRATSANAAHRLVERLADAVRAMTYGEDRDADGRIGYVESEMGLAQARYHLSVVERLTR